MTNNTTLTYRVGQLEKQIDDLDGKIDKIMTNHLPHLDAEMMSIKTRVGVLTAVNVGAIILGLLAQKFL